jgi:hypothetical protein
MHLVSKVTVPSEVHAASGLGPSQQLQVKVLGLGGGETPKNLLLQKSSSEELSKVGGHRGAYNVMEKPSLGVN